MYLNRRAELEAWDIEQEFRRAFAAVSRAGAPDARGGRGAFLLTVAISPVAPAHAAAQQPDKQEIDRALEKVKADPNLATARTVGMLRWKNPAATGVFETGVVANGSSGCSAGSIRRRDC